MLKELKPNHLYFVIKISEPYAEKIFNILKEEQIKLNDWPEGSNITFEEWIKLSFGEVGIEYLKNK